MIRARIERFQWEEDLRKNQLRLRRRKFLSGRNARGIGVWISKPERVARNHIGRLPNCISMPISLWLKIGAGSIFGTGAFIEVSGVKVPIA